MTTLLDEYTRLQNDVLAPVATQLEALLRDHLGQAPRVDRVTARAKRPDRFIEKAGRLDKSGKPKYSAPMTQIQDQIAARIIVFYLSDVEPTEDVVLKYFQHIERQDLIPESEWEFGYFGRHYVLALPNEAVPEEIALNAAPRFFELQIKTLFQHAWSEAEHDLGYKASGALDGDQKRRLAFTAAQSWGADRVFGDLWTELTGRKERGIPTLCAASPLLHSSSATQRGFAGDDFAPSFRDTRGDRAGVRKGLPLQGSLPNVPRLVRRPRGDV